MVTIHRRNSLVSYISHQKYHFLSHEEHILVITFHAFHEESEFTAHKENILSITLHAVAPDQELQA